MTAALIAPAREWAGIDLGPTIGRSATVNRVIHMAQIVLIVAIAVVLIAGIVAYSLIAYQCIKHGYHHVAWYGPNGWKIWQFKIVCNK